VEDCVRKKMEYINRINGYILEIVKKFSYKLSIYGTFLFWFWCGVNILTIEKIESFNFFSLLFPILFLLIGILTLKIGSIEIKEKIETKVLIGVIGFYLSIISILFLIISFLQFLFCYSI